MSSGASGSDEKISGAKIDPLASDAKSNVPLDMSSLGVAGSDRNIDQTRIDPVGYPIGGKGQYQHPAPHADSGVISNDANLDKSKIEPLEDQRGAGKGHAKSAALGDPKIDAARVHPLGEVREQMS